MSGRRKHSLRGRRFVATVIDLVLLGVTGLLIMLVTGIVESADAWVMPQPLIRLGGLFVFTYLLLNGYLLLRHGQTIGKRWLGLKIVGVSTASPLGIFKLLIRSYGVLLVALLAGSLVGVWGVVVVLVLSVVTIFGPAQRCLHDHLARSAVVRHQAGESAE